MCQCLRSQHVSYHLFVIELREIEMPWAFPIHSIRHVHLLTQTVQAKGI